MSKIKAVFKLKSIDRKAKTLELFCDDSGVMLNCENFLTFCYEKYHGYALVELSPPYKKRTTGKDSQNSHIWGHIQQIAQETGNDIQDVEEAVKLRAIKRGYPYHINKITQVITPNSMKTINTVEASYLIEELHQLAAELDIRLEENK